MPPGCVHERPARSRRGMSRPSPVAPSSSCLRRSAAGRWSTLSHSWKVQLSDLRVTGDEVDTTSKRTYGDRCGVARALDLVGERWALLVVRELLLGPKRFTDLRTGLPHVRPHVLS